MESFEHVALLCRLDVNEHVGNARVALLDCVFYSVRNLMAFVHRDLAVHSDVQIDIKIQTHFAGSALFNFDHAGNCAGN
jgi:hypothetical protein